MIISYVLLIKGSLYLIVISLIISTIIFYELLQISRRYRNIKSKYDLSLKHLKAHEEMLNKYRICTHENRNQLLIIRNMVKDNETKEYIDELIDNKEKDDMIIYNDLIRIPLESIRSTIYSKVLLMKKKDIKYNIVIARNISIEDFIHMHNKLIISICNVLNVFIDNAIESANNSQKRQILIEFNRINNELEIAISNTCDDIVDLNKIYGMGYSTKGGDHGYGLSLVKSIINKNSKFLRNSTEKSNDVFTQYLYINLNVKM